MKFLRPRFVIVQGALFGSSAAFLLVLASVLAACSSTTLQGARNTRGNSPSSTAGAPTTGLSTWPGWQTAKTGCTALDQEPPDAWGRWAWSNGTPESRDTLWFINVAPRFAGVDVYVDSQQVWHNQAFTTALSGLFAQTNFVPQTVVVTATGAPTTVLASAQITLGANRSTTLLFTQHTSTSGGLIVLYNTVSAPPPGYVSFRIVNAAPVPGSAVDVYRTPSLANPIDHNGYPTLAGLTPVLSNIPFEGVSPYVLVPAGPNHIIVTTAGDPNTVLYDAGLFPPNAGEAWTMIFRNDPACWPNGSPLHTFTAQKDRGPHRSSRRGR